MSAKSLVYTGDVPYVDPEGCGTGRTEVPVTIRKNGRLYRIVARDKITVEDPYIIMVKAEAFSIRTGEPFQGTTPPRAVRDYLVKNNIVI